MPARNDAEGFVGCPQGTKLAGGGVGSLGIDKDLELAATMPQDGPDGNSKPDGWFGLMTNDTDSAEEMLVTAICAKSGKYKYVANSTSVPDLSEGAVVAACPAGTKVTSGGAKIEPVQRPEFGDEITETSPLSTSANPNSPPDDGWIGRANNDDNIDEGEVGPRTLFTAAVCRKK